MGSVILVPILVVKGYTLTNGEELWATATCAPDGEKDTPRPMLGGKVVGSLVFDPNDPDQG